MSLVLFRDQTDFHFSADPEHPDDGDAAASLPIIRSVHFVAPLAFERVNGSALADALARVAATRCTTSWALVVTSPRAAAAIADALAAAGANGDSPPAPPLPCFVSGPRTAALLRDSTQGASLDVVTPHAGSNGGGGGGESEAAAGSTIGGAAALVPLLLAHFEAVCVREAASSLPERTLAPKPGSEGAPPGPDRRRALFARGDRALEVVPAALAAAGVSCEQLVVYMSHAAAPVALREAWASALASGPPAALAFFSPSGFESALAAGACADLQSAGRPAVVAIGATTAAAIEARGATVDAIAATPDASGVRAAVWAALRRKAEAAARTGTAVG